MSSNNSNTMTSSTSTINNTTKKRSQSVKVNPLEFPEFPVEHFARPQGWYGESKIDPRVKQYEASEHSETMYYDATSCGGDYSESGYTANSTEASEQSSYHNSSSNFDLDNSERSYTTTTRSTSISGNSRAQHQQRPAPRFGSNSAINSTKNNGSTTATTTNNSRNNLVKATAWVHPKKHQEITGRPSEWMNGGANNDHSDAAAASARRRSSKRPTPIKIEGYN